MENEIWKPIHGYNGLYEISNLGRVKGIRKSYLGRWGAQVALSEKILKCKQESNGYWRIGLLDENRVRVFHLIHRLVAIAFIPNPDNLPEVNHKYGDKSDNRAATLEWITTSQNVRHSYDVLGKQGPKGEKQGRSKLKEDNVLTIRDLYKTGNYSFADLGDQFNVTRSNIRAIVIHKSWTHI